MAKIDNALTMRANKFWLAKSAVSWILEKSRRDHAQENHSEKKAEQRECNRTPPRWSKRQWLRERCIIER
jgi:hypothetical protein